MPIAGAPRSSRATRVGTGLDASHVCVDAGEFEEAVEDGIAAFIDGRHDASAERLDHALDLYKGDFLSDAPFAPWARHERSRLHELAVKALRLRAEVSRNAGDVEGMLEYVGRLGRMEPFDMSVQRQWPEICLNLGRHGQASRHYADLRRRMMREFGQRPPFELADLIEQQQQLTLI